MFRVRLNARRATLVAAIAAAFPALPTYALTLSAEADSKTSQVVVQGDKPSSLPTEIPTTIEGIQAKEIERNINAIDAEDALKYLPSLLVRKRYVGDYNHAVLATRASGTGNSARSMVYADGILLSNLLGNGATFTPRWGLVTPEEIERVDVLYGPSLQRIRAILWVPWWITVPVCLRPSRRMPKFWASAKIFNCMARTRPIAANN